MKYPAIIERFLQPPRLTRLRIGAAISVALVADGLQFVLGPLGMVGLDQFIDVAAMVIEAWLIGFHWLLLPTFALEFIPLVDMLPTWTGCVALVVAQRRRAQSLATTPPLLPPSGDAKR